MKGGEELENRIAPHLDRKLSQVDPIEHAVLRVATCELLNHIETPYKVVVNEYVNLAKKYGAEQAHKFVNGVLDKVATDIRPLEVAANRKRRCKPSIGSTHFLHICTLCLTALQQNDKTGVWRNMSLTTETLKYDNKFPLLLRQGVRIAACLRVRPANAPRGADATLAASAGKAVCAAGILKETSLSL